MLSVDDLEPVDSSAIKSIGWDPNDGVLTLEFPSGVVWDYSDFPETLWDEFVSADSVGKFYHRHIKGKFAGSPRQ